MKITRQRLSQIIKEELAANILNEQSGLHNRDEGPHRGILLAGDSQMSGYFGDALSRAMAVEKTWWRWGAPGKAIAKNIDRHIQGATEGAVVNFGDNDWENPGVEEIVSTLKKAPIYQDDPKKIVVIGPPPTFRPSNRYMERKERKYISLDESHQYYWKKIWEGKKEANETIGGGVEAAGMTFINPYDYIPSVFPELEDEAITFDGVHYAKKYSDPFVDAIRTKLPGKTRE